jgi:RNA polymerase sigma-70 factor, ECF subfamily
MQVIGGLAPQRGALSGSEGSRWRLLARFSWLGRRGALANARREPQPHAGYATPPARLSNVSEPRDGGAATVRGEQDGEPSGVAARALTFDEFYARHEQPLYGYLRRLLPSHELAVELAQEVFFRAWRHFETLSGYDRPEAWLYRVATNLAISQMRRKAPLSFSALLARMRADSAEPAELAPGDLWRSPLDLEERTAERDQIDRILRALPERHRAALLLAAVHGFTSEEIAGALAVTPDNARQMLSRARAQFRRLYDRENAAQPVS